MKPKKRPSTKAGSAKEKNETAVKPALKISAGRLWLFRICAPVVALVLVIAGLELALRLCGYGYPASFFLKTEIAGKEYDVSNDRFGYRFFPPALARTPTPMRLPVEKPPNAYRIFVFGESAAMGDPDPTFGAWRYLQVLLRERFPGTDFEVVCAAMTAINSHVILPMARECARHDGDLWIVYMGNNEMVGPFGAGSVFGSRAAGIHLVRASLELKRSRFGQFLDGLARRWDHSSAPQTWGGLNMFKEHELRYDDPSRLRAYENFRQNLNDILRAAQGGGTPVILSTVGSNLKDCAPFASLHSAALTDAQKSQWDAFYQQGIALESSNNFPDALKKYQQAGAIDSQYAELHFRSGRCQLALTNDAKALREFELARDDDALAFRADSRINQIIADAAQANANRGVHFLDALNDLAEKSPAGIPGNELFYEHVHLNFKGNYLLARAFAEETLKLLPKTILARGKSEWASADQCDQRLGVSPWDRCRVWQENYSRVSGPPFTSQLNAAPRADFYRTKLKQLAAELTEQNRAQARAMYEQALTLSPDDYLLRENFAQFLDETGDLADAPAQEEKVAALLPQNPLTPCIVGRLLVRLGNSDEAEKSFSRSLAIRPDYVPALNEMGMILANQHQDSAAAKCFARALKVDASSVDAGENWGFMEQTTGHWKQASALYQAAAARQPDGPADYFYRAVTSAAGRRADEAFDSFNIAIRLNPNFWQARYLLGALLASAGKTDEAQAQFADVTRIRPDFAPAHLDNALILAQSGKPDEALKEFQITLRLDPTNQVAQRHIEELHGLKARSQ